MSAADLYVRARQFFGFFVPGFLWMLFALVAMSMPERPTVLLQSQASLLMTSVVVGGSYLAGLGGARAARRYVRWYLRRFPPNQRDSDKRDAARLSDLRTKVIERMKQCYPADTHAHIHEVLAAEEKRPEQNEPAGPEEDGGMNIDFDVPPLFGLCKRMLKERSLEWRRDLDDHEEQINLFGMLPLPLVLCAACWTTAWCVHFKFGPPRNPTIPPLWDVAETVIPLLASIVVAHSMVQRLWRLRRAERKECYEMFLLLPLPDKRVS